MRKLRIGVDIDGVLYDFVDAFRRYMRTRNWPEHLMTPPTRWDFFRDWGLTQEEFLRACHDGVNAGVIFRVGTPLDGASETLHRLRNDGHEVHLITDRFVGAPGAAEASTRAWLADNRLPFSTLSFTADKTSIPTDAMVEDRLENYDSLVLASTEAFLIDRSWNRAGSDHRRRITDLRHFADAVRVMATTLPTPPTAAGHQAPAQKHRSY